MRFRRGQTDVILTSGPLVVMIVAMRANTLVPGEWSEVLGTTMKLIERLIGIATTPFQLNKANPVDAADLGHKYTIRLLAVGPINLVVI